MSPIRPNQDGSLPMYLDSDGRWQPTNETSDVLGGGPAGAHPDLAAHTALGLAASHAHNYSATGHTHSYEASGAVATHEGASNPHPTYLTAAEGDATYAATDHSHGAQGGEAFPVGSVFISVVATDPATLLGYGTWAAFGAGRVLIGNDGATYDTDEATGGSATSAVSAHANHTHTYTQVPNHVHVQTVNSATTGGASGYTPDTSTNNGVASGYSTQNPTGGVATGTTANESAALSHADVSTVQPYIVVHMWKRTA